MPIQVTKLRLQQSIFEKYKGMGATEFGSELRHIIYIEEAHNWYITTSDWKNESGRRQLSLIPQWADADGGLDLPKISPDWDASPYGVMEFLSRFDLQSGYSFAWYFYMLHGNRITSSAGNVIAKAIKAGWIHPFPECDERVLLGWYERQYGF